MEDDAAPEDVDCASAISIAKSLEEVPDDVLRLLADRAGLARARNEGVQKTLEAKAVQAAVAGAAVASFASTSHHPFALVLGAISFALAVNALRPRAFAHPAVESVLEAPWLASTMLAVANLIRVESRDASRTAQELTKFAYEIRAAQVLAVAGVAVLAISSLAA